MDDKVMSNVITFVYDDYAEDETKKVSPAKCRRCKAVIKEKTGTTSTSGFVRHLSTAVHPHLRKE